MPAFEILLDTSTVLAVLSYHTAQQAGNERLLQILSRDRSLSEEIDRRVDTRTLCVADMTMVEVQVTYIKNALFEYARTVHQMPVASLYSRRTNVLKELRSNFTSEKLPETIEQLQDLYATWELHRKLHILPNALSREESIVWRRRQELVFQALSAYESFETQDAYIVAAGIAAGVDTIWSADGPLRACLGRLRDQRRQDFIEHMQSSDPELFADLSLPRTARGPTTTIPQP